MPRSRAVGTSALALLSLVLPGHPARAQSETAARAASFDSAAVLDQLRKTQRDFERLRQANAPTLQFDLPGCDIRLGKDCYHSAAPSEALPEPAGTDGGRAALLEALEDGARLLPGDPWIAGQRVRYLVEHGRPAAAAAAARECRAERWWCAALEGFALHAGEDDAGADAVFAEALAEMPPTERCTWTDLTLLLGDQAGPYAKLPCEGREARNPRLWWLGRPLYIRAGNDLRVEHYARHVMARLLAEAPLDRPVRAKGSPLELVIRFGWPVSWVREPRRLGDIEPGNLVAQLRSPAWSFFPQTGQPPAWNLNSEHPGSIYGPTWATTFSTIDHLQIARFRRGDSVVTVAGFDLSTDTVLAGLTPRVSIAVGTDAASPLVLSPALNALYGAVAVQSIDPPTLVSLEAIREEARWVGRFRSAAADATSWFTSPLSDILLVRAEAASSGAIDKLTSVALPGTVLPGGRPVGIYWEWYERPAAGTVLAIEARVAKIGGKGRPDPLGRSACAPPGKAAIAVQWREQVGERPAGVGRVVALDLTRLQPGRYLIAISVGVEGAPDPPRCTSREIQLAAR